MDASGHGRAARAPWAAGLRTGVLLCAAAALAAGTVPASAQGRAVSAASDPSDPVVVVTCASEPQVRPREYVLACGDGNNQLVRLHWDAWGPKHATATGTDMVNDCKPYCAAGRFHAYPVKVTLSRPQPWPGHPALRQFTAIRLLYTGEAPPPGAKDVMYKLVW